MLPHIFIPLVLMGMLLAVPTFAQDGQQSARDRIKAIRERLGASAPASSSPQEPAPLLTPEERRRPDALALVKQRIHERVCQKDPGQCFGAWIVSCELDSMFDTVECTATNDSIHVIRGERFNHLWIFVSHGHSMPGSYKYLRVDQGKAWSIRENDTTFPKAILAELRHGKQALTRSTSWPEGYTRESTVDLHGLSEALDSMESRLRTRRATR